MDVKQSARALTEALRAAGRPGHFEALFPEEVEESFEELRDLGLEPSRALAQAFEVADPVQVEVRPWLHEGLRLLPLRELPEAHEGFAVSEGRRAERWRGRWIILGVAGSDPYFVDATQPRLPVYTDIFGGGALQPLLVASSWGGLLDLSALWVREFVAHGLAVEPPGVTRDPDAIPWRARLAWQRLQEHLRERDPAALDSPFWRRVFEREA